MTHLETADTDAAATELLDISCLVIKQSIHL